MDLSKQISDLLDELPNTRFLSPDPVATIPGWMRVESMSLFDASAAAPMRAPGRRVREWDEVCSALHRNELWHNTRDATFNLSTKMRKIIPGIVGGAIWDSSECITWYACGLLVEDKGVDITWLRRWWTAWKMGYYPVREDGDTLVVAEVKR